jgi:UDP-GlcNAc:undecaprenyl-phosphate GlcNAc-1-phosphate transferase
MAFALVVVASFLISFLLMPSVIAFSRKRRLFDDPGDNGLKVHKTPIPFLGGIGIFAGFIVPVIFFYSAGALPQEFIGIIISSVVIIGLGVWDDLRNINPFVRLGGQLLAAGLTISFGLKIHTFPIPYVAVPLTLIYILGSINSVNLFDGLDGLAGGVASISFIGFSVLFYLQGDGTYTLLSLSLLGAVCGFLFYNFNPARIFLGDNGSTFLGYMLAVFAINASSKPYAFVLFLVPLMLIGLPVVDTVIAIVRRVLSGKPVFIGDRSHLYDQLVDKGYTVKGAVLICYTMQAAFVVCSIYLIHRFTP